MIKSFKDPKFQEIFDGRKPKGFQPGIIKKARRAMLQLDASTVMDDMKVPPGNKLHPLTGDREGQHAVWINDQYRLVFKWNEGNPTEIEIIDYHDEKQ